MKTLAAALVLVAIAALALMSLAPPELVGARGGLASPAGVVTAVALVVVAIAGGWLWWRDKRVGK